MTTTPNAAAVGLLPVTQADREAAGRLADSLTEADGISRMGAALRSGRLDHGHSVQAFAAHRLAAERPRPEALPAEVEDECSAEIVERLRAVAKEVFGGNCTFADDDLARLRNAALPPAGGAQLREAAKLAVADAAYHLRKYRPHVLEALEAALAASEPGGSLQKAQTMSPATPADEGEVERIIDALRAEQKRLDAEDHLMDTEECIAVIRETVALRPSSGVAVPEDRANGLPVIDIDEPWAALIARLIEAIGIDEVERKLCSSRHTIGKWVAGTTKPRISAQRGLREMIATLLAAAPTPTSAGEGKCPAADAGEGGL